MNPIVIFVRNFSHNARLKRAEAFRKYFTVDKNTKILDLGSENGTNIWNVLRNTKANRQNVFIADIDQAAIDEGAKNFGYNAVLIDENESLPFADKFFDIVYCSSVIEHTTIEKSEVWNLKSGSEFNKSSWARQQIFASEIERLGKQYFVQTPCKTFPVESHTWLPLVCYLPRETFLPVLKLCNRFWVKQAEPDFNLLGVKEMQKLFPEAEIICERILGLTKSVMAIKTELQKKQNDFKE